MKNYSLEIELIVDKVLDVNKDRIQEGILLVIAQLLNGIGLELTEMNEKLENIYMDQ